MSTDLAIKTKRTFFDQTTQVFLPVFTITGFFLTSIKQPAYGLAFNLIAQVFWMYASWKAWKNAGQIGIFITSLLITVVLIAGVANYWIF